MAGQDELRVAWIMEVGQEGVDHDKANPFARAIDRLLHEGQPIQRIGLCFTSLPDENEPSKATLRWLGVFVFSAGNRLIFFPGYSTVPSGIESYRGKSQMVSADITVDHLSLERDREGWHVTSPQSRRHFGGPTTLPLGDDCVLWFGMSVARSDELREVKQSTAVSATIPASDITRRTNALLKAREATVFPLVQLNPQALAIDSPCFYHFSVIVGPVGFPTYEGPEHGFPVGSPHLVAPLPTALLQLPTSAYRLSLAPVCDVQVTVMRLPGSLCVPISFTGPSEAQASGNVG